ncbi:MAG: hypothetical protein F6J97_10945 [Leptolyngbya sp. SIO4C1]|nr:hypothetical protein [Leptolyngbya sp. SIO4C1]
MEICHHISRQRVRHIVDSYCLAGSEAAAFATYLESLLEEYWHPLIELALVETLAKGWSTVPLVKGIPFLQKVHRRLKQYQQSPIISLITPDQFEQITGLDATPIFRQPKTAPSFSLPAVLEPS